MLRLKYLPQALICIVLLCWLSLMYTGKFSVSTNNYDPLLDLTANLTHYPHRHYQCLLRNWMNPNNTPTPKNDLAMDDDIHADIVRTLFVEDPMFPGGEYGFSEEDLNKEDIYGQLGAPILVDRILGHKRNGFFIEAGAVDGLHLSNTLFFETRRNFTGILIEPSSNYTMLRQRNRKVKSLNVCLSRKPIPEEVTFLDCYDIGGIEGEVKAWTKDFVNTPETTRVKKTCLPVHAILAAVGNPKVNYFSLDIEGVELDVLKSIPWDKVDIDIFSIEVYGNGRDPNDVSVFMRKSGYTKVVSALKGTDDIYVRDDFRSPIFGPDQKPKSMIRRRNFDLTRMGNTLCKMWFNTNCASN